jgi:molybdate transport system ATP-binding protein
MADELTVQIERRFPAGVTVAVDLHARLAGGTILVLFGPSGSGKTTTIRAVAGLERPDAGVIRFGGLTWFDAASSICVDPQQRRVGYVFQEAALFPHLSVRDNVCYGIRSPGQTAAAGELLELLELGPLGHRYPRQLSGGQAQRVALARAVAPGPNLLLLDEPFAALDTPARSRLRRFLRAVVDRLGIAALLVTHDRSEAIALGDQMAVLTEGRIRQVGAVADVFRRPADLAVARSVGVESVVPARVVGASGGLLELQVGPVTLKAVDAERPGGTSDVFACIRAEEVTLERAAAVTASARNHLPGRVLALDSEGPLERVTLDCGFPLTALITRQASEELALAPGVPVVAAIKATAVHLVARA